MIRTQVYLTVEQHRALKRGAASRGIPMTEWIRRILDLVLLGRGDGVPPEKEEVLAFVALGESGRADTSERHDEALDEALRAGRPG